MGSVGTGTTTHDSKAWQRAVITGSPLCPLRTVGLQQDDGGTARPVNVPHQGRVHLAVPQRRAQPAAQDDAGVGCKLVCVREPVPGVKGSGSHLRLRVVAPDLRDELGGAAEAGSRRCLVAALQPHMFVLGKGTEVAVDRAEHNNRATHHLAARVHGEGAGWQSFAGVRHALQREHQVGVKAAGNRDVLGWRAGSHGFRE